MIQQFSIYRENEKSFYPSIILGMNNVKVITLGIQNEINFGYIWFVFFVSMHI